MIQFRKTAEAGPYALADIVGEIPYFLNVDDPRSAREQLDAAYQHGGGWRPMKGWTLIDGSALHYSGDPPLQPWAEARLRNERICVYESAWVAIVQPDGSVEVSRMD